MAVKKHGVHFDITAENAADRALQAVEQNLNRVNRAADAVGRTLQGAFIATAAISAGKAFANAAIEAERAQARLGATLKATGGVIGQTAEDINNLADAMAVSTEFDDETLRNGAAQLVKFGTVHGQVFKDAMAITADLASFMGTDFTTAVQSVGKALHSPNEGLTALEKQIGKLDPTLKKWLDKLVENGQVVEAQNLVLQTLRGRIGGVAEAMNTGLFKATNDVKKAWDEMLESVGRTDVFQSTAKSGLGFLEQSLKDIKEIVENGDWVEKVLAVAAFAGGWRGFKLTPQGGPGGPVASGKIGGLGPQMTPEQEAAGAMMNEDAVVLWRKNRERMAAEEKRRLEQHLRDAQKGAEQQLELEEMAATDAREAWAEYEKYFAGVQQDKQHLIEMGADGQIKVTERVVENAALAAEREAARMKAWFAAIDKEQDDAIEAGEAFLEAERARKEALKESEEAARDLGFTFASAFEDAVLGGKKLSDILRGLAKDVARIFLRKTVTEPLANAASDLFKDIFRADGGPVSAGEPYIVGERGPELMVPGASGAVVPNHALRGMSGGQTINIYPDLRGASQDAVEALHRMVIDLRAQVPGMALGAYQQARTRGRL